MASPDDQIERQCRLITSLHLRISRMTRRMEYLSERNDALETENRGLRRKIEQMETAEYWGEKLFKARQIG